MVPDQLVGNLGDVHIYLNHEEAVREQIKLESFELPSLRIEGNEPSIIEKPQYWKSSDFEIIDYKSHKSIKAQLNN